MREIEGFFAACRGEGAWPGGVHLEYTGDNVTECLGGSEELAEEHLDARYETLCDPRLNGRQALDLAFRLAELMRRSPADRRGVSLERITIVGTGLIGASVGLAAAAAAATRSAGTRIREALAAAVRRGAVDACGVARAGARDGAARRRRGAGRRACPPRSPTVLARSGDERPSPTSARRRRASSRPPRGSGRFVGGHPMAGSEARGAENASAGLFEGATWFLTPDGADRRRPPPAACTASSPSSARSRSRSTRPAHDRLVALTSHLPHVLANLIVNRAGESRIAGHDPLASAGGSLRDMTRIAGANPRMWIDVLLDNADAVARASSRELRAQDRGGRARRSLERRRRLPRALHRARRPATGGGCSRSPSPTPARSTG